MALSFGDWRGVPRHPGEYLLRFSVFLDIFLWDPTKYRTSAGVWMFRVFLLNKHTPPKTNGWIPKMMGLGKGKPF